MLLPTLILAMQSQAIWAQDKSVRNAAGAVIVNSTIQQNKIQRELQETKKELEAIREGLGIERPASSDPDTNPAPLLVTLPFVVVLCLVGALGAYFMALTAVSPLSSHIARGDFEGFRSVYGARWFFYALGLSFGLLFCGCYLGSVIKSIGTGLGVGMVGFIGSVIYATQMIRQPRMRRLFDREQQKLRQSNAARFSPMEFESSHPGAHHWLRMLGGEVRGPCYKKDILAAAAKGAYAVGTQWGLSKDGPWEPLVHAVSTVTTDKYWVRTSQGKRGGPFTKEQIVQAIMAGTLSVDSVVSSSADGPWRSIESQSL